MVFRILIEPTIYVAGDPGEGPVERAMWGLAMGMTEPSILGLTGSPTTTEHEASIVAELSRIRDATEKQRSAPATSDVELARACVDHLLGRWSDNTPSPVILADFATASLPVVEGLLVWIKQISTDYPGLLNAARFGGGDPTYREMVDLLTAALLAANAGSDGEVDRGSESSARQRARALLDAAIERDDLEEALRLAFPRSHPSPSKADR